MDIRQNLDVKVQFTKPFFFVGESIQGYVILQTEKSAVIEKLIITIFVSQKWEKFGELPIVNERRIGNIPLDLSKILPLSEVEGFYLLKGGRTKVPFKIKIVDDLDPCFEYPLKDKYAFLRYKFNVSVYSISFKQSYFNFNLRLFSRPNIDNKKKILNKSVSKTLKKWGLFGIGTTILTVSIPDNNFKYDDTNFKIIIFVDNSNGKEAVNEARVKLTRLVEFIGKDNEIRFSEQIDVATRNTQIEVLPQDKKYIEVVLPLKEEDTRRYIFNGNNPAPYDLIMNDINYYMPTLFSRIITCKYELSVTLNYNCRVSESSLPKITFPIYIVHQSPFERQLELQKEKILEQSVNNFFNLNQNNNINNNNKNNFNNKNLIGNKSDILNNKNNINIINNYDEEAPAPFFNLNNLPNKNINNINNIFMNNFNDNLKDNKSKMFTNNQESINFNGANNINYNVNINISHNIDNSVNNNFNNNSNNSNNNSNKANSNKNSVDEDLKDEIKDLEEDKNEIINIKQSSFNLL